MWRKSVLLAVHHHVSWLNTCNDKLLVALYLMLLGVDLLCDLEASARVILTLALVK